MEESNVETYLVTQSDDGDVTNDNSLNSFFNNTFEYSSEIIMPTVTPNINQSYVLSFDCVPGEIVDMSAIQVLPSSTPVQNIEISKIYTLKNYYYFLIDSLIKETQN